MFSFYRLVDGLDQLEEFKLTQKDAARVREFKKKGTPPREVKKIATQLRRYRERQTHQEIANQLDEYGFEKKLSTFTKLKPSVFFPLRRAKKETKSAWGVRGMLRSANPAERSKELFNRGETPFTGKGSEKRVAAFLGSTYKAAKNVSKREKETAKKAAKVEE